MTNVRRLSKDISQNFFLRKKIHILFSKLFAVMSTNETYSGSSKARPEKNSSGGYGNYCCVPGCTNAFYNSKREKTGITLFKFPVKDPERNRWLKVIKNLRRKGGADNFDAKKRIFICEFHFKTEDIRITMGVGRKKVIPGRIPSIFESRIPPKKSRKSPKKRPFPNHSPSEEDLVEESESTEFHVDQFPVAHESTTETLQLTETDILRIENMELKQKI